MRWWSCATSCPRCWIWPGSRCRRPATGGRWHALCATPLPTPPSLRPWREWLHGEHVYFGQSLQWVTDGHIKYLWASGWGTEELFDLDSRSRRTAQPGTAARTRRTAGLWKGRLIADLTGREEGFVHDGELVAGAPRGHHARARPGPGESSVAQGPQGTQAASPRRRRISRRRGVQKRPGRAGSGPGSLPRRPRRCPARSPQQRATASRSRRADGKRSEVLPVHITLALRILPGQAPRRLEELGIGRRPRAPAPGPHAAPAASGWCAAPAWAWACWSCSSWTSHSTSLSPPRPSFTCRAGSAPRGSRSDSIRALMRLISRRSVLGQCQRVADGIGHGHEVPPPSHPSRPWAGPAAAPALPRPRTSGRSTPGRPPGSAPAARCDPRGADRHPPSAPVRPGWQGAREP